MRFIARSICILVFICGSLACYDANSQNVSEDPGPHPSYKLTFVVRQLAAGKINGERAYSTIFTADHSAPPSSIRAGNRVPVFTGKGDTQYLDVGANIDFRVVDSTSDKNPRQLRLFVTAEVSSIKEGISSQSDPLIRQAVFRSECIVNVNKSTMLFSADEPSVDQTTQVELTAVPIP